MAGNKDRYLEIVNMGENTITNREIERIYRTLELFNSKQDSMADSIARIETMIENRNGVTEQILEQAKKTNGRVTSLEKIREKAKGYVLGITASIAFLSGIISAIVSMIVIMGNVE